MSWISFKILCQASNIFLMGEEIQQECQNWVKGIGVHHTILSPFVSLGQYSGWKVKIKKIQVSQLRRPAAAASPRQKTQLLQLSVSSPHPKSGGCPKLSSPPLPPSTFKLAQASVSIRKAAKEQFRGCLRIWGIGSKTKLMGTEVLEHTWGSGMSYKGEKPPLGGWVKAMGQDDTKCPDMLPS